MNLIKSTSTYSFFVLISRILGYLRDLLIAIYLGSGPIADAFFVAFRIPNTFRRLFSEGTFNSAFVPSYISELDRGKKSAEFFANNIFNFLFLSILFLILIIEIFMPLFVFTPFVNLCPWHKPCIYYVMKKNKKKPTLLGLFLVNILTKKGIRWI